MITHGVKTPLHEFCQLIRSGEIPRREVGRLIEKYKSKKDPKKALGKVLASARAAAAGAHDKHLQANVLVIIAGFSYEDEDVNRALEAIRQIDKPVLKFELVRILADTKRLPQAVRVATRIKSAYYRTEAFLYLANITKLASDFARARESAKNICDENYRKEAIADIDLAEAGKLCRYGPASAKGPDKTETVKHLVKALVGLQDFDEAHQVASSIPSIYWRVNALATIAEALPELLKGRI